MIASDAIKAYRSRRFQNHTWMKKLRASDLLDEIHRLPVPPRFKTDPWLHQLVCWWLGYCFPEFLFLLDMGTGKTWILLNLIEQRLREGTGKRALVCVPRQVNMSSWLTATEDHSHLEPWLVDVEGIDEKWERLIHSKGDFTLIDYQGLTLACSEKRKGKAKGLRKDDSKVDALSKRYDTLILDESHLAANHENLWFSILRHLSKDAKACYAATGTLFGKNIEAVWSQFFLVDGGRTFGKNLGLFRATFFTAKQHAFKGQELVVNKDQAPLLNRMINHRSIRYEDTEVHDLPPCVSRRRLVTMGKEQTEHYLRALEGLINAGGNLKEMEARWLRMRQITSGYLVWKDENGEHEVIFDENPKLEEVEVLLSEAGEQRIVMSYEYTPTGKLLVNMLKRLGVTHEWLYKGTKDPIATLDRYKKPDGARVFVMNSAAGGTGVDGLQKYARYLFFVESPSNPTPRQQTLKRVYRAGQEHRTFVYDIAAARTVDVGILNNVQEGRDFFEEVANGRINRSSLLHF